MATLRRGGTSVAAVPPCVTGVTSAEARHRPNDTQPPDCLSHLPITAMPRRHLHDAEIDGRGYIGIGRRIGLVFVS